MTYENQQLSADSTLTLEGLTAGNYTVRLTVSDTNGMKMERSAKTIDCFSIIFLQSILGLTKMCHTTK
jgi:hypothetical protein